MPRTEKGSEACPERVILHVTLLIVQTSVSFLELETVSETKSECEKVVSGRHTKDASGAPARASLALTDGKSRGFWLGIEK